MVALLNMFLPIYTMNTVQLMMKCVIKSLYEYLFGMYRHNYFNHSTSHFNLLKQMKLYNVKSKATGLQ